MIASLKLSSEKLQHSVGNLQTVLHVWKGRNFQIVQLLATHGSQAYAALLLSETE